MLKTYFLVALMLLLRYDRTLGRRCENIERCELIALIKDFFLVLEQPSRITTSALCWGGEDFRLLTTTLNGHGFMTTPSKGDLSTYWPHEQQMFLVDLGCPGTGEVLVQASRLNLLEYPFRWLLVEDPKKSKLPSDLNMFVRSKVYLIEKSGEKYKITSKYRLGKQSKPYLVNDVATWKRGSFEYYNRLVDARNRTNLMKLDVNSTMVIFHPETADHLLDGRDRHIEPVNKVNYPLTLHVIDYVNATVHFVQRDTWGFKYSNTTQFIGMMGDMQNGIAEIGVTAMFYIKERIPYIDAIASTTPTKGKFIFKAPPLSFVKNVYVLPFRKHVWWACFGLSVLAPLIFYVITYWELTSQAFNRFEKTSNNVSRLRPSASDILQIQIGAICQQGSEAEPISGAGRIATIFVFVAMLFLYTSYSANIVALLQSTTDSIKTLDDLLSSRISLGVEDTPYNKFYFTAQPGKIQQAIYHQKVAPSGKPDGFMDLHSGVSKMQHEFFAFHTEVSSIYKVVGDLFLEHEKCGLIEIEYYNMYEPFYAIRKNTTYGELFKAAIRKMGERGLANRALRRIYVTRPTCQNQGGNFLSVSLTDCYAAFLIFSIGVGVATLVFVVEKIVHNRRTQSSSLAESD